MKHLLLAATALFGLALASPASATVIAAFSQNSLSNTVTATDNAANTQTTISIVNASTDVSALFGNAPVASAFLNLTATSFDAAVTVGGALLQHYNGVFCISALAGCTGTDYISGAFTDAAFGGLTGPGLVVNVNNPPDSLTLSSSVIAASNLVAPNSLSFGFSNIATPPGLHIQGTTIAPFTAAFAGTVSATTAAVPEPAPLAILGVGLLGLGLVQARRRA